ncbi:MAG: TolC family protein [Rhodospirillales bacterium]|nr:TolC family protein [Rhodospirillales bacterium]
MTLGRRAGIKSTALLYVPLAISAFLGLPWQVSAESLSELVPQLLKSHNLIKASEADLDAASQRVQVNLGAWFPTMNILSHYGLEKQNKPTGSEDTNQVTREADITFTLMLWDFGATNATIRASYLSREAAQHSLEAVKQDLILRAITAFMNVRRQSEILVFSEQSEANIKRQTEIEDALVQRGAGLSTDVLNAKQQLAGAQARRVEANGQLVQAKNAYRSVFQSDIKDTNTLNKPTLPMAELPSLLGEAIEIALRENPKLKTAEAGARVSRETINSTRATGFFPTFNMIGEAKVKEDVGGTLGSQNEMLGKFEMNFPFNLGFTAINTLKAAKGDATAADRRVAESRDIIEQEVRDSWSQLTTARDRLIYLKNQANIAAEFLELARRERKLGNRTLNDILTAETQLINANSASASAETDVAIAVYTVLNKMGRLTAEKLTN